MSNQEMKIGSASLDGGSGRSSKLNNFKIEEGSNYFRILPPLWSLADSGQWYKYWRIHWGFSDSRGIKRPIVCLERKGRDGDILVECPIDTMIRTNQATYKLMKDNGKGKEELYAFYENNIKQYLPRGHYYVYALNAAGEVGIVKLPKTAKEGIVEKARELQAEGIDLMGMNGVYVNIRKSGKGLDTKYNVDIAMEADKDNPKAKVYKEHSLTPELIKYIQSNTTDLANLYSPLSAEDLQLLVSETDLKQRGLVLDSITGRNRDDSKPQEQQVRTSIPGTSAVAVGNIDVDHNTARVKVSGPDLSRLANTQSTQTSQPAAQEVLPVSKVVVSEDPAMSEIDRQLKEFEDMMNE